MYLLLISVLVAWHTSGICEPDLVHIKPEACTFGALLKLLKKLSLVHSPHMVMPFSQELGLIIYSVGVGMGWIWLVLNTGIIP